MKFSDLLAFVKAGYTAAEVKELLAIQPDENNAEKDDDTSSVSDHNEEPEAEKDDINVRLAELEKQNELLTAQLKSAQNVNIQQNNSNENKLTDEDTLLNILNNFT